MFLIDTNIWLEVLLQQEQAPVARNMIGRLDTGSLTLTDFSLHSIGVILFRLDKPQLHDNFLDDLFVHHTVARVSLSGEDLKELRVLNREHGLDFDDAYQYAVATRYELEIVSFDSDFDDTDIGRLHPGEVLERFDG